jgi:hypothetical protein
MGLLPSASITDDVLVLTGAEFITGVDNDTRMLFEADALSEVNIGDIVAMHGDKTPLAMDMRAFRGAFVLVTATPATDEALRSAAHWAQVFGGDVASTELLSFEAATGGRATMETQLPARR